MATALATDSLTRRFDLVACAGAHARRVELQVERRPDGLAVSGRCLPAWPDAEVEVSAGFARRVAPLESDGAFCITGLPSACRHANVVLRGPGAPAIAVLKVPVAG